MAPGQNAYTRSCSYDRIGNITYKSDVGSYAYTYNNQPHAVRTAGAVSLQYDLAGNMTQKVSNGVTLGITWNADNRPTLITRNGSDYIQYTYDGMGNRVRKVNLATGFVTRYYGEVYEERGTTGVIHLFANTTRIASVRTDGTIQYYHGNHLGSASVITDSTGTVKETMEYLPFGGYRVRQDLDGSFPDVNYTFTDQEDDDETGLYNYKARLYDPLLGRFISADSIIPEPGNLQAFNRYSYCVNNPLVYVDPSGHWSLGDFFDDIGDFFSDVGDAVWQPAAEITAGAIGACIGGPIGAGIAVGLVRYGITGDANAALASAVQAGLFYGAGEVCPGNPYAHAVTGAAGGGIGAAITGQDIGPGMLVGGISGFAGTFAGGYMKGWDPAFQLIGRSVVGGVVGGIGSEIYGGSFGEGFKQGALTAGYAEIFNDYAHFIARAKQNRQDTDEFFGSLIGRGVKLLIGPISKLTTGTTVPQQVAKEIGTVPPGQGLRSLLSRNMAGFRGLATLGATGTAVSMGLNVAVSAVAGYAAFNLGLYVGSYVEAAPELLR